VERPRLLGTRAAMSLAKGEQMWERRVGRSTGRCSYSSSELIRGVVVSDALALASISACSHCLRVRPFL
jgi:hypothetical protein